GHEQVVFCHEESVGLRAIIAIHDTTLGPSLGGARLRPYASDEEALRDALRLSEAMTYKAAVAGLGLGGGKAVIIADPKQKSEALLRAFGRFVKTLGGRYITAEDVNTSVEDMEMVLSETKHVCGLSVFRGGSGDPSPVTAYGVLVGLKATVEEAFGSDDLRGKRVAVQGLGKVGFHLAKHLVEEGADVVACDIREERAQQARDELSVEIVSHKEILEVDCDIVAPCALGAALNDDTIPRLRCKVVAGAANNQLAERRHAADLEERGILYAPDYVINSGGLINVYCELDGYNRDRALRLCNQIGHSLKLVYEIAKQEGISTDKAANLMARRRIDSVRRLRRFSSRGQNV
ncbi:MAG: Glu/Leu/Phe/Val dehydrogenase dimerization domain-containing protein, partial [Planctomycetota bacterium]